jgi:hypothetical protein
MNKSVKGLIISAKEKFSNIKDEYNSKDKKEKTRIVVLALSSLLFLDYVMFSYHVESSIFDIFPSIPVIEDKVSINIYMPSEGASEIISESREIYNNLEEEVLVKKLFSLVAAGSFYENTALNVPIKYTIKKIWITNLDSGEGKLCAIDLMPEILDKDISVVKNSEALFRESLEKTILENVPEIKKVMVLEKGVPYRKLWEI